MTQADRPVERHIETMFVAFCEQLGIRCEKLKLASMSSWPDRTLLYKGQVMFMELKRRGEKPTPLQEHTLNRLRAAGFEARWSDDYEQMKLIVLAWKNHVDILHGTADQVRA